MVTNVNLPAWEVNPYTGKLQGKSNPQDYTPLVNINLRNYVDGATPPIFGYGSTVSTDFGQEGRSVKVVTTPSNPGSVCGTHGFAGRQTLPQPVPLEKTIWQRMKFRFPAAFSFGYTYANGSPSSPAGDGCGGASADGNPTGTKFLVFSPNAGTGRIYFNMANSLRSITQSATSGVLAIEANPGAQQQARHIFARDTTVTVEMACKVSYTAGFVRIWINGVLLAEAVNVRTIADLATAIVEFGLGDYWNGTAWTDGVAGRNAFYVDEILVASDIPGCGAPTATDAAGNLMIGTTVLNRDFA